MFVVTNYVSAEMFYGGVARSRSGAAARALCHLISIIRIPDTEYGYPDSLLMHVNTNMDTGYRLSMHARVSYLYFDLWTLQLARAWLGIMDDYEQFLHLHLTQLRRVPEHLWTALHYKLRAEVGQLGHVMLCVSVAWIMKCCENRPTLFTYRCTTRGITS